MALRTGGGCICRFSSAASTVTGRYHVAGNQLTVEMSTPPSTTTFCVEGDVLGIAAT